MVVLVARDPETQNMDILCVFGQGTVLGVVFDAESDSGVRFFERSLWLQNLSMKFKIDNFRILVYNNITNANKMENLIFLADIKGYEDEYGATEEGEIYSLKSKKFMEQCFGDTRKLKVTLTKEGIKKNFWVHRIIAETFIPNPDNYSYVYHIDRNKINNNASNLRWATRNQLSTAKAPRQNTSSKYKGVSVQKCRAKVDTGKVSWLSHIRVNNEHIHIGSFQTEIEAAVAYNEAVQKYFGDSDFHYKNII